MNIPWIEKYRPLNFDQILYNIDIINVIKNFINNKNIPNIILYGSSGIGKTSIVNIIVNSLYINNKDMVLELNNSDDRGINIIRNIREYARQPSVLSYIKNNNNNLHKLIILDEADSLTYEAQYALRRIIELYSNKIRFCMICNNLSKLDEALISRCNIFKLLSIPENIQLIKLKQICEKEKLICEDKYLLDISKSSNGDMRQSINVLEYLYLTKINNNIISYDDINNILSDVIQDDKIILYKWFDNKEYKFIYKYLMELKNKKNININKIIEIVFEYLLNKLLKIDNNKDKILFTKSIIELSKIEKYVSKDINYDIQILAIISIIIKY